MPPIYRVKNVQKEGVFTCDYAKTPQKESKKVIFRGISTTKRWNHRR